jgi:predicted metal-dependent hydrolase/predicted DCC family thiol-disulfide oxidoreductase YuxK
MRVARQDGNRFRRWCDFSCATRLKFCDQTFGLPHVQAFLDDALGGEFLIFFVRQPKNHFRVTDRKPTFAHKVLDRLWQFNQSERIRYSGAAFTDLERDFFLRELKLFRELRVTVCFFNRVEIFTLQIFDECEFQNRAVVGLARDDGNFRQIQKLRRAPAAFTCDQFKKTIALAHDERLHDALLTDGIGQFAQRFLGELFARLERGRTDFIQRHAQHALAIVGRGDRIGGWLNRRGRGLRERRIAAQQRAETATQSRFCHARRVSNAVQCLKSNVQSPNRLGDFRLWTLGFGLYSDFVSHKSARIAAMIESFRGQKLDAHYLGYFDCFNRQLFYEAHDVLEDLWLPDRHGVDGNFYKGLIQLAGAFVHLQKNRLRPAAALFKLARTNLEKYPRVHENLDLKIVRDLIRKWLDDLESQDFKINPLTPANIPQLGLVQQATRNVKMAQTWVLYDGDCSFCTGAATWFAPLLHHHHFALATLQTPWVRQRLGLKPNEPLVEMKLLMGDGRICGGVDALLQIARALWWAWPVYVISFVPGFKSLLRITYRRIAARRNCANTMCALK